MATSYTSLLGLALPVQGELSGTWGDTVNNYISNYVDAAVAGAQTVTTDTTLTKTTGSSLGSTSSQYAIIIASPASANITITAPAASKIYTIINTSGTYTVKICGAGPTTGVTLGVNEKAQVAWNGSDFIKISNTGGAASFTNVTVTGTTTLSGLTASTALALDASKNVVSVTNTGTGNNVLSASPTLTGTIAGASLSLSSLTSGRVTYAGTSGLLQDSANLTFNGTTLTANTLNLTNALGTTYGGTGLTSFTANGVVYASSSSVLATGSALTFDGAGTLVSGAGGTGTNNSVLRLNGSDASSYGSYLQFQRNSVNKWTIGTDSGINGGTSDDLTIFGTASQRFYASSTEQMRLTSTGLGIGTSSPGSALEVKRTSGNAQIAVNYNDTNTGRIVAASNGNFYIGTSVGAGSVVIGNTANADAMTLDASGNLGVGTSSPAAKLHVGGNQILQNTGSGIANNSIRWQNSSGTFQAGIASYFNTADTGNIEFLNGGTTNMQLSSSGNLGLGVTPSAWTAGIKAIDIGNGSAILNPGSSAQTWIYNNAYNNSGAKYKNSGVGASWYQMIEGEHAWYNAPSGTAGNAITFTQAMTLDANGSLLIGTTSTTPSAGGVVILSTGATSSPRTVADHASGTSSGNSYANFTYAGTVIGSITQNGTTGVLYNITSDQRLKENIQDAEPASNLIDAIQVRQFDWKSDGSHQRYGFVAQELVTVAPEAVNQPPDSDEMMAVDYSKLVPMLVKEIQSLRIRIAQLEAK
jgi:hypothetical protein